MFVTLFGSVLHRWGMFRCGEPERYDDMKPLHLKSAMAAVAVLTAVSAQSARADSYF